MKWGFIDQSVFSLTYPRAIEEHEYDSLPSAWNAALQYMIDYEVKDMFVCPVRYEGDDGNGAWVETGEGGIEINADSLDFGAINF